MTSVEAVPDDVPDETQADDVVPDDAVLHAPQGSFGLLRLGERANTPLRAWDAADEYLLREVAERDLDPDATGHWLVVNDGHGALGVALAGRSLQAWGDSLVAERSAVANLERNGSSIEAVRFVPSTDDPAGPVDVALVKVPRSMALLEEQLCRLKPLLAEGATVIGAGMVKYLPKSAIELFERIIGPTTTSLAKKKARLLYATPAADRTEASPFPTSFVTEAGLTLVNHANVFSRDRLDIGTRFLLDHLPAAPAGSTVVDLGCGNGALGVALLKQDPSLHVHFVDESPMAVASAMATHEANGSPGEATFGVADGLEAVETGSVDLIVNNPPFHDGHNQGDSVAWQMFDDARRVLRPSGELRVVGNRHLGYHAKLKRLFGNCETVAANPKFVILSARW